MPAKLIRLLRTPGTDAFRGLERCLEFGAAALPLTVVGLFIGWWLYVPIHELSHALACVGSGGEVTRLEIKALYGGGLLSEVFSFVVPTSDYAGRLSGFDTRGNDLTYLATVLGPFLLTVLPGVLLLRVAAAKGSALLFGSSLPFAFAPFLSLTGDAYEIGSILVTRLPPWSTTRLTDLLRGDDLLMKITDVHAAGGTGAWVGMAVATFVGACWAWSAYLTSGWLARVLGYGEVLPLRSAGTKEVRL